MSRRTLKCLFGLLGAAVAVLARSPEAAVMGLLFLGALAMEGR